MCYWSSPEWANCKFAPTLQRLVVEDGTLQGLIHRDWPPAQQATTHTMLLYWISEIANLAASACRLANVLETQGSL